MHAIENRYRNLGLECCSPLSSAESHCLGTCAKEHTKEAYGRVIDWNIQGDWTNTLSTAWKWEMEMPCLQLDIDPFCLAIIL